jgi:hypothetical protein
MKLMIGLIAALALSQAPPLTKAEQLQEAARKGDAATVKKLLDEGVDVNTKFRYQATAIFYAADHGHLEVVKVLLDKGAALDVKDTFYGFTPLMLAAQPAQKKKPEHLEIAKLLIAKGAPGKDILPMVIQTGDAVLAKAILDSGGIPPATLSDAFETARAQNKTEMAAMLEQAGAKPYEDFKLEPAQLARLAGVYKNAAGTAEITVVVTGARLTATTSTGQKLTLVPQSATVFKGVAMQGTTIVFQGDGDKASGFTVTPVQGAPVPYTRVEGK